MGEKLEQIRNFADEAHGDQQRKYSTERYIVHPVRVMEICEQYDNRTEVLAAALLHDVLEDTPKTQEELYRFLCEVLNKQQADKALRLVIELTDVYTKKAYPKWNRDQRKQKETERLSNTSGEAQTIKYADILDNTNEIVTHDRQFAPRFLKECLHILTLADKGNKSLRKIVTDRVLSELELLKS